MADRIITAATDTPDTTDHRSVLIGNFAAGITMTLDTDANASWEAANRFTVMASVGVITITMASGVTVDGSSADIILPPGSTLALVNLGGGDAWGRVGGRETAGLMPMLEYTDKTLSNAFLSIWPTQRSGVQNDTLIMSAGSMYAFGPFPRKWDFVITDMWMVPALAATGTGECDFAFASVDRDGTPGVRLHTPVTWDISSTGLKTEGSLAIDVRAVDYLYLMVWMNNGNTNNIDLEGIWCSLPPVYTPDGGQGGQSVLRADVGAGGIPADFSAYTSITGNGAGDTTDWGTVAGTQYVPQCYIGG